ncbi:MAG TPA: hypothetical protein DIV40_05910 [Clostridiales bacterium]|nr:hypothetical protein [Clostridiales bacterium]
MNKWHIYEMLKRHEIPTTETIEEIENMNATEVKEGLLEWFTLLSRDKNYQSQRAKKPMELRSIYKVLN